MWIHHQFPQEKFEVVWDHWYQKMLDRSNMRRRKERVHDLAYNILAYNVFRTSLGNE